MISKNFTLILGITLAIIGFILLFFIVKFIYNSALYKKSSKITRIIKAFMSKYGFMSKNEIYFSFRTSTDLLKKLLGKENYLYELPWILVCGPAQSGKTSLIQSIQMDMPIGPETSQDFESIIKWSFFDKGTIINTNSSVFLGDDNYQWQILANVLHNKRKKKPIDGLVLTIPMEKILEYDQNFCQAVQSRLWQLQKLIGIKFPVYVVITKTDITPGFITLTKHISDEQKNEMFGWSNPYQITEVYTQEWLDNYAQDFDSQLRLQIAKILSKSTNSDNVEELILLPKHFANTLSNLTKSMNTIFKNNKYIDSFILRGIYFTGAENIDTNIQSTNPKVNFITDLFKEKIFQEHGIMLQTKLSIFSQTRNIKIRQFTVLVGIIFMFFKLSYEQNFLKKNAIILQKNAIKTEIQIVNIQKNFNEISKDTNLLKDTVRKIMTSIENFYTTDLTFFSMPYSLKSFISNKIDKIVTELYKQYIFKAINHKINAKIQHTININTISLETNAKNNFSIAQSKHFENLSDFINNLSILQKIIHKLSYIQLTNNIGDFNFILSSLFEYNFNKISHKKAIKAYLQAANKGVFINFNIEDYQQKAIKKFNILMENFMSFCFNPEEIMPMLQTLKYHLKALEKMSRHSTNAQILNELLKQMTFLINYTNNPNNEWIIKEKLQLGKDFDSLMLTASNCKFIGNPNLKDIQNTLESRFHHFREQLLHQSSNITGPFFEKKESGDLQITQKFMIIYGALNLMFSQSFINLSNKENDVLSKNIYHLIVFSKEKLKEAIEDIENYDRKINTLLGAFADQHKESITLLIRAGLNRSIMNKISDSIENVSTSQIFHNMSENEMLSYLISNLNQNIESILYIIQNGKAILSLEFYEQLLKIFVFQCEFILNETEKIISDVGVYYPPNIRSVTNTQPTLSDEILIAYNVTCPEELIAHFAGERERLSKIIDVYTKSAFIIIDTICTKYPTFTSNVYNRWKHLISDVKNYMDTTKPNAIHSMEKYILVDIMQSKSYSSLIEKAKMYNKTIFFKHVINTINKTIIQGFLHKQRIKFFEMYDQIKDYFNKNLAGKFPFAKINDRTIFNNEMLNLDEVTKEEMTEFLLILKQNAECFEIAMKDRDLDISMEIRSFLEKMLAIYKIFKIKECGDIELEASIDFHTADNKGKNLDNVSGTKFKIFNEEQGGHSIRVNEGKKKFNWNMQNGIEISITLSHESQFRFPRLPNVSNHNTLYKIQYNGNWSLFKLFLKNQSGNLIKIEAPIVRKNTKKQHQKNKPTYNLSDKIVMFISIDLPQIKRDFNKIFPTTAPEYISQYEDLLE